MTAKHKHHNYDLINYEQRLTIHVIYTDCTHNINMSVKCSLLREYKLYMHT